MKSTYLKLVLPMIFATLLANADELNFTKNLPMDSKKMMIYEDPLPTYDNRINFGPGLFSLGAGVSYTRIKPDSTYIEIATSINPHSVTITAMGGYNFLLSPKDVIRPAAGLAYHAGKIHRIFPVLGVGYEHAFNDTFSLGADAASVINGDFNFAIGTPFTFHFGDLKRWEVRLTPYLVHAETVLFSSNTTALSCSLGYRF